MTIFSNKKHLQALVAAAFCLSFAACVTTPPAVPQEADAPREKAVSFALHEGTLIQNRDPLPNYKVVLLDWTVDGQTFRGKETYRLWDINKDGQFDMVERVSSTGFSLGYITDFNGDGQVDFIREKIVEK